MQIHHKNIWSKITSRASSIFACISLGKCAQLRQLIYAVKMLPAYCLNSVTNNLSQRISETINNNDWQHTNRGAYSQLRCLSVTLMKIYSPTRYHELMENAFNACCEQILQNQYSHVSYRCLHGFVNHFPKQVLVMVERGNYNLYNSRIVSQVEKILLEYHPALAEQFSIVLKEKLANTTLLARVKNWFSNIFPKGDS